MAKSEMATETDADVVDPLAKYAGKVMEVSDIPGEPELLDPGDYAFQLVGYKAELKETDWDGNPRKNGPSWDILIWLDPTARLDEDEPQDGFEDLRQFHRINYVWSKKDLAKITELAAAFGVKGVPAYDGHGFPALDEAKGFEATVTVEGYTIKMGKNAGKPGRKLVDFRPYAD